MITTIQVIFKTLLGFSIILVMTRSLGKKQIGQLSYLAYITGISIGNMAGSMVIDRDIKVIDGILGLIFWCSLVYFFEYISLKSPKGRVLLDGEPTIVIKKGKIVEDALIRSKLNMDDLSMLLRNKDIFSIKEVDYAILEPNGKLSVLRKSGDEWVKKKDLHLPITLREYLPSEIIVDGRVVIKNLREFNLSEEWLDCQLQLYGIDSKEKVIYAELQSDGSLYINKKQEE